MPKQVEIEIFPIARTMVCFEAAARWLRHLSVSEEAIDTLLVTHQSDPSMVIALAAKRCYMSFEEGLNPNVTKVRKDMVAYFDNLLTSKHGSVLEHAVYSFAIEGVSRVFTAEMNRHRAGWAISEGSLRFIRFDKEIPYWLPTSLRDDPNDDADLKQKKHESRHWFQKSFEFQEQAYENLIRIWEMDSGDKNFAYKKKVTSCFRRIVGMGVATGGVWTGNIRALRHVIAMRAAPAAEEEIFHVFYRVAEIMLKSEPLMFGDMSLSDGYDGVEFKNWKV